MDWKNVNLESAYESSRNILEPISFDDLLLVMSCNVRNISKDTLMKEFTEMLAAKVTEAEEIFMNNAESILKKAIEIRNIE